MEPMSNVTTALTTVKDEVMTAVGDVLPIAASVFAALAGIGIGFKFFKKITGTRAG